MTAPPCAARSTPIHRSHPHRPVPPISWPDGEVKPDSRTAAIGHGFRCKTGYAWHASGRTSNGLRVAAVIALPRDKNVVDDGVTPFVGGGAMRDADFHGRRRCCKPRLTHGRRSRWRDTSNLRTNRRRALRDRRASWRGLRLRSEPCWCGSCWFDGVCLHILDCSRDVHHSRVRPVVGVHVPANRLGRIGEGVERAERDEKYCQEAKCLFHGFSPWFACGKYTPK